MAPENQKKSDFSNKELVKIVFPILLDQLLVITVGVADSVMVSSVSDAAISAVSLVDAISTLLQYLFSALATGGAIVAGQYIGKGSTDQARNTGQHLIAILCGISLLVMSCLYIFQAKVLALLFGQVEAAVMDSIKIYYAFIVASIPGIALYNGGAALLRVMGRTSVPLGVSVLMNLTNVFGNAFMIFTLNMGVKGVAIPTLVSRTLAAAVTIVLLFSNKYLLHLKGIFSQHRNTEILKQIFHVAIPNGVEQGMQHLGKLVLFSLISTFGTASIVANAIGGTVGNFHIFAGQAIGMSLTTVISQCIGAGEPDKAQMYMNKLTKVAYLIMASINVILILLIPVILRLYDVSGEAAYLAKNIMLLHGISSIFLWIPAFMIAYFLRAAGDVRYTMRVSMCTIWLCRVVFAVFLGKYLGLGVIGVWLAHTLLDWICRTLLYTQRYRSGIWRKKRVIS